MDEHTSHELAYRKGLEDGKPKWIPVTEMLPKEFEDVLVVEHRKVRIGWKTAKCEFWYVIDTDGYMASEAVTHWMPLPEPPKGE